MRLAVFGKSLTGKGAISAACAALWLAGCAGGPSIEPLVGSDPSAVREALRDAAKSGDIPVLILDPVVEATGLTSNQIARAVDDGVKALDAGFTPSSDVTATGPRVIVAQGAPPLVELCTTNAVRPSETGLVTAYCAGDTLLGATITGPIEDWRSDPERLIWRSVQRLTQDDYARRYGLFGSNIGVSVGVGVGF